jgi:virulence-associated protein VagC
MSLLAIKGIYENGHITLEKEVETNQAVAIVVTFLTEKLAKIIAKANWESWFASMSQFSDDFMIGGREQPQAQDRWV